MFLKHLSSKAKEKFHRHRSRSRSPSSGQSSLPSLQDVQASVSNPSAISSAPNSIQKTSLATETSHSHQSLPILTITEPTHRSTIDLAPSTHSEGGKLAQASSEKIWDRAYDELKAEDAALVQAYERILSSKLQNTEVTLEVNVINQHDKEKRRSQMHQLVKGGLDKISQETKAKSLIGSVLQTVNLAQNIVTEVIKDVPQAALPWAAVCLSLELLTNPISETEANCRGVSHVVEQMNWYCELAELLFSDKAGDTTAGIQRELQTKLIDLYKKLLSFELKSICSYYRHRALIFLGDLIKLDDWEGNLKAVQEAETFFNEHVHVFQSVDLGQDVKQLVAHAKDEQEYRKTDDDKKCLRDLYITDPRMDKSRIESTKGGLIQDSYRWILSNSEFKTWLHDDNKRLLWIKGDPGKGKTMLLCGIVDEIKRYAARSNAISFFFCQATIPTINNHLAVLRGLIWLLADQQPSLISHIREKYDPVGKDIFEGTNAWYTLASIFRSILQDEKLTRTYLIIDGLDECTTGLEELLQFIKEILPSKNVKCILSSRNWASIRRSLEDAASTEGVNLSLEVNAAVVTAAVKAYISEKASIVPLLKQDARLKEEVCNLVHEKANGTFLWVAIVFQQLQHLNIHYDDRSSVMERLNGLPKDLTELYDRMLQQIGRLEKRESDLCEFILGISVLAYQPLRLQELATLAGFKGNLTKSSTLQSLIQNCGSFLTVKDEIVYFIHQSSKDYLTTNSAAQSTLFPNGVEEIHHKMAIHAIDAMAQKLCRDIYHLNDHAILLSDVSTPEPDPLISLRYPCSHWLRHICDSIANLNSSQHQHVFNDVKVLTFLRGHILHWLEVMSLMRNPPGGILYISRFEGLLERHSPNSKLLQLIHDIRRFTQHNSWIIDNAPLQIYLSAILFSPKLSLVRSLFEEKLLSWIATKPFVESHWSSCLQTLQISFHYIPIAISNDMKIVASDHVTNSLKIWDIASGKQIRTLEFKDMISQVVFSSDSKRIVAAVNGSIVSWNLESGTAHRHPWNTAHRPSISNDGMFVASSTSEGAIQIQGLSTGAQLSLVSDSYDYGGHEYKQEILLSNNAKFLAFGYDKITIWDVAAQRENMILITSKGHWKQRVCFSSDSKLIALESGDINIWDLATKSEIQTLHRQDIHRSERFTALEFSPDSKLVAGGCWNHIWVWDVATGNLQTCLNIKGHLLLGLVWSSDSKILASAIVGGIKIWDMNILTETEDFPSIHDRCSTLSAVTFSNDYNLVATTSPLNVKVWDVATGCNLEGFERVYLFNTINTITVTFSPDAQCLYVDYGQPDVKVWNIASETEAIDSSAILSQREYMYINTFSRDGKYFAGVGDGATIWNMSTGEAILHFAVDEDRIVAMAFSNNAQYIGLLSSDRKMAVWDVIKGDEIMHIKDHVCENMDGKEECKRCDRTLESYSELIAISNDGRRALLGSDYLEEIWISTMGQKTIRLPVGRIFSRAFGSRESYIATCRGYIDINDLENRYATTDSYKIINLEQLQFEGYGLSADGSWITWNGSRILWLPFSRRPTNYSNESITIFPLGVFFVTDQGEVMIIKFSGPPPA